MSPVMHGPSPFGSSRRRRQRWLMFALYLGGATLVLLAWVGGLIQAAAGR